MSAKSAITEPLQAAAAEPDDENVPGGVTITITVANNNYSYTSLDSDMTKWTRCHASSPKYVSP